jgi:hypothetical protein
MLDMIQCMGCPEWVTQDCAKVGEKKKNKNKRKKKKKKKKKKKNLSEECI